MAYIGKEIVSLFLFVTGGTYIGLGEDVGDFIYNFSSSYVLDGFEKMNFLKANKDGSYDVISGGNLDLEISDLNIDNIEETLNSLDISVVSDTSEVSSEPDTSLTPQANTPSKDSETKAKKTCRAATKKLVTGKTVYTGPQIGPVRGSIDSRSVFPRSHGYRQHTYEYETTISRDVNCVVTITYNEIKHNKKETGQGYRQSDGRWWNQKTYGDDTTFKDDLTKLLGS